MIFSHTASEDYQLSALIDCLKNIKQWLNNSYLQLKPDKTETLIIAPDSSMPDIKQQPGDLGLLQKRSLSNLVVICD